MELVKFSMDDLGWVRGVSFWFLTTKVVFRRAIRQVLKILEDLSSYVLNEVVKKRWRKLSKYIIMIETIFLVLTRG